MEHYDFQKHLSKLCMLLAIPFCGTAFALDEAMQQKIGQAEYNESCVACHGTSGKGDGPVANFLSKGVPNLTQISKRNNGFPTKMIYQIIDGSKLLGPHGSKEMPIWGDRYRVEASNRLLLLGDDNRTRGLTPEVLSHSRILSLVYHLESIQK